MLTSDQILCAGNPVVDPFGSFGPVIDPPGPTPPSSPVKARNCGDIWQSGRRTSMVYTLYIGTAQTPKRIYCDMTTNGGGWMVCHYKTKYLPSCIIKVQYYTT